MILTVCQRGNVRSVTLATILKDYYGMQDVIPIGYETTSAALKELLYEASDSILITHPEMVQYVGEKYRYKVYSINVGKDIWGKAMHPELVRKCLDAVKFFIINQVILYHYPTLDLYLDAVDRTYNRA